MRLVLDPPTGPDADGVTFACIDDWPMYCAGSNGTIWSRWSGRWERLSTFPCSSGHLGVNLVPAFNNRARRRFYVQVLVLLAFDGPPPFPGAEGCHVDGDKTNNAITNVRWDSQAANNVDRSIHRSRDQGTD